MPFTRDLLRGSLELVVLSDLSGGHRYGYQILTSIREQSAGRIDLKAGTLYPILHKLERESCVRSWWDDAGGRDRKWYALTERGAARLRENATEWEDYASCIRAFLRPVVDGIAGAAAPQPPRPESPHA